MSAYPASSNGKPDAGDHGLDADVRRAINILPLREQAEILEEITRRGEITAEMRIRIADLIDARIAARYTQLGIADDNAAREQVKEYEGMLSVLDRDMATVKSRVTPAEEQEQADVEAALVPELHGVANQYQGVLAGIEKQLFEDVEASAEEGNQDEVIRLQQEMKKPTKGIQDEGRMAA